MAAAADTQDWLAGAELAPQNPGGRPAKSKRQSGRMRKLECSECGFIAYASAGALQRSRPSCCGEPLQLPNVRDRLAVEPDELQRELEDAGFAAARSRGASTIDAEDAARVAFNDAMREIGRHELVISPPERDQRGGTKRCSWEFGYCQVFVSGRYCADHDPAEQRRRGVSGR